MNKAGAFEFDPTKVCGCGWQRCHYCAGADNCYSCHPEKKLLCSACGIEHTHQEPCVEMVRRGWTPRSDR